MRILLAQINPIIGDLTGNTQLIIQAIEKGRQQQADIVLFPELAVSGYPPEDFLLLPHFIKTAQEKLAEIVTATENITVIVGLPRENPQALEKKLYNSAAIIQNRQIIGFYDKILLPVYDVFDERRYFEPGEHLPIWNIKGKKIGITICEDLWQHAGVPLTTYRRDPIIELKEQKPDLVLNLSASPYSLAKFEMRRDVCQQAAKTLNCPVLLCNQVGGNDSLIFDGNSLYALPNGVMNALGFVEDLWLVDTEKMFTQPMQKDPTEELFQALVLGVHDYFKKLGFKKACLGLSGGIDSALTACIAVAALGAENVLGLSMPSRFTSAESKQDAEELSRHLGIELKEVPIETVFEDYLKILEPHFSGRQSDATEENLQARVRGMLLMAFSNKLGYIVLSTGNKSEMSMGYSTLYGDLCGGLAVLSDVTKRQIYALARWINSTKEMIPENSIKRAPSAELRPNQKDSDSLPDYEVVDNVLEAYVEEHQDPETIAQKFNYPIELVRQLVKRIHDNEYKRRQSPPGLRVTEKAFTIGRRFPIVQKWV